MKENQNVICFLKLVLNTFPYQFDDYILYIYIYIYLVDFRKKLKGISIFSKNEPQFKKNLVFHFSKILIMFDHFCKKKLL